MSEPAGTELCHGQSRSQSQPAPDLQVKCDDNSRSKLIVHFLTQMEIDQFLKNNNSDCDIFYNFSRFLLFFCACDSFTHLDGHSHFKSGETKLRLENADNGYVRYPPENPGG